MGTIRYTTTHFREPNAIDEGTYKTIKAKLSKNPEVDIDPNPETFTQTFNMNILLIVRGLAVMLLGGFFVGNMDGNIPTGLQWLSLILAIAYMFFGPLTVFYSIFALFYKDLLTLHI